VQQVAVKKLGDKGYLTGSDVGLALGIVVILTVLFLPVSPMVLDIGLAFSIALSVLISRPFRRFC
jgi:flagellar biosynthesis protein FlhA